MSATARSWLLGSLLAGLTIVAYWPLWQNDFIDLDDQVYITGNPHVLGGLTARNIGWAWSTFHAGYFQPLTWMSLQLDASLFTSQKEGEPSQLNAAGFHAHNLVLHLATTVLLFLVLRGMTGREGASWFVAGLFAVHPLHVESVAWATERKDVLSTFFWVLAMGAYWRYVNEGRAVAFAEPEESAPGEARKTDLSTRWYGAVLACFALGILAKPMVVTFPFVLLLLDVWPLRRVAWARNDEPQGLLPSFSTRPFAQLFVEKLPLFMLAVLAGIVTILAQRSANAVVPVE